MKKLTPLFLSAAALVALSPEVADAAQTEDPLNIIPTVGDTPDERVEERPQIVQPETPSTDEVETVEAVTTDDQLVEVKERREQDVTAAVLDESSVEVDQVYHTPVQDGSEYQYEEHANTGDRLDDRNKNEVHTRFTVNDQSKLVNRQGEAGAPNRVTLGEVDYEVADANDIVGASNFKLVNRGESGPKTIVLSNHDLITDYNVEEKELEDGTFQYKFDLKFRIPNNSISTVYDLIGTFIDENNNAIDKYITLINVVHQDMHVEIRDERTHPNVDAYQPDKNVNVPFKRVIKYVQHDEPVYVVREATGDYEVGDIVVPDTLSPRPAVSIPGRIRVDGNWVNVKAYELNLGERITIQNGVNGSKTIFYKQEFVDGEAATEVIEDPFAEVGQVGRTTNDGFQEDVDPINEILLVGSVITDVDRVWGVDRFQNSVKLSQEGWNDEDFISTARLRSEWGRYGSHVFIANADKYADSLTGTPLAAANGAPILLTRGNTLNGAVADELERLYGLFQEHDSFFNNTHFGVTILGGINSISNDVSTAIGTALSNVATNFEVDRIGGIDRYHQAFLVADEIARIREEEDGDAENSAIYIASGDTFSDALAIAAQAGEYRNPVLLTRGNTLNEYARRFLEEHISEESAEAVHLSNVNIVGGTATISQAVADQINEILADKLAEGVKKDGEQDFAGGQVNRDYYTNPLDFIPKPVTVGRIAGANRYEVSRNVNKGATYTQNAYNVDFSDQAERAYTHYLVVSGDHPSDALPASALANQLGAGVLLVSNNSQRAQEQLIAAIENGVTDFTFIGGVNTLSDATLNIFNYSGDTIRAIIDGPENFSSVINTRFWTDLLNAGSSTDPV